MITVNLEVILQLIFRDRILEKKPRLVFLISEEFYLIPKFPNPREKSLRFHGFTTKTINNGWSCTITIANCSLISSWTIRRSHWRMSYGMQREESPHPLWGCTVSYRFIRINNGIKREPKRIRKPPRRSHYWCLFETPILKDSPGMWTCGVSKKFVEWGGQRQRKTVGFWFEIKSLFERIKFLLNILILDGKNGFLFLHGIQIYLLEIYCS